MMGSPQRLLLVGMVLLALFWSFYLWHLLRLAT